MEFFQGKNKENELLLENYLVEEMSDDHGTPSTIKEIFLTWNLREAVFITLALMTFLLPFYAILQSSTYFLQELNIKR